MSDIPAYRFGMSEFTTHPWTFEQDIEHYAQLDVDTVEVCEIKLDPQRIVEQLASIPAHHLAISSVQPQIRTLFPSVSQPEPLDPAARMKRFKQTIDAFGDAARGVPLVTNTGIAPNGNIQHLLDVAVEQYRDVAEHAAQHGAEVGDQDTNLDVWERGDERFEPLAATAHDHEVVSVSTEPSGKRLTDAGGGTSDQLFSLV